MQLSDRFRGFLPVVIDVETGGFNAETDALLELAAVTVRMDEQGLVHSDQVLHYHIEPFPGSHLDPDALAFNGIDPHHPFRQALSERKALQDLFTQVRQIIKQTNCQRAVLVGHNAFFDNGFLRAAVARCQIKNSPFHSFTTFDTATLSALAYGQTVLAKALKAAGIDYDPQSAHGALYDAEQTAKLFCNIVNRYHKS